MPDIQPADIAAGETAHPSPAHGGHAGSGRARRIKRLSGLDRVVVALMVLVPTTLVLALVIFPAIATVLLSFTRWTGVGGLGTISWIGTENYVNVVTNYPPFNPALQHNVLWLAVLFLLATPLGMFLAVLLDKELKGGRFYQTAFFLPVVLSLALIGFIWQLLYSRDQGLLNAMFGTQIDWFGDPKINIWATLVAASWRHVGYIMLLYLAGLKGVDAALREAASMDGATQTQTFFRVVFPALRPINIIVLVVTGIEALRAFDLVWIINKGRNGLELISALVTTNVTGEASRIGFGSALATIMLVIAVVLVVIYLSQVMREEKR